MVLRDLGLEKSSAVVSPVAKRPKFEELLLLTEAKPLNGEDTTLYRSFFMRVNYFSLDRSDLSFAVCSLARGMKSSTTEGLEQLCLNRMPWLESWRYSVMQTMLETWERENPDLEWRLCGERT